MSLIAVVAVTGAAASVATTDLTVPGQLRPVASTAARLSGVWQSRAMATSFKPMARNSRASSRRTQFLSVHVVPPLKPKPDIEAPKLLEPIQVSVIVVTRGGAYKAGAALTV